MVWMRLFSDIGVEAGLRRGMAVVKFAEPLNSRVSEAMRRMPEDQTREG